MRPPAAAFVRFALLALAFLLPACSDNGGDVQAPDAPAVAQVVVEAPDSTVAAGQTVQLTAAARDSSGNPLDGRTFTWASADAGIAAVSEAGLVTAVAAGQTTISATADGVTGRLAITVTAAPGPVTPGLQPIATGLAFPLALTSPPGDDRLFIAEKRGTIRIIKGGVLLDTPFLDLSGEVSNKDEQGLLGFAFPPDYATSGRFVVHYSNLDGDTRVSIFHVSSDPDRADPASESPVLAVVQPGPSHKGGQLAFGPDGMLYIGLGDGTSRDYVDRGRGQSLDDLFGNILRIDVSSGSGYAIPPDNPFVGNAAARPEIWSYGLRNPWRFSFDRANGDLFIADVGQTRWEEINRATAADGGGRGVNYGWVVMEGDECAVPGCDQTGLTLPLIEYNHDLGCAVIGGYVYRGAALPALQGKYFYGDYCGGWVRSIQAAGDPGEPVEWPDLKPGGRVVSFGQDNAGELYVLTGEGGVFKIVAR